MPMSHRVRLQVRNGRLRGNPQGLPAMLRRAFLRVIPFLLLTASAQANRQCVHFVLTRRAAATQP
jgi:hypothetical protein